MAKRAFLDDNKGRDYPFLRGESFIPFTSILACGFVIGPNTGFMAGQHSVALTKVKREFGRVWFYFTCDAPGLLLQEIIFSRLEGVSEYALEYADSSSTDTGSASESLSASESSSQSLSLSESESDTDTLNVCGYVDDFSGFLITGDLTDLLAILDDGQTIEGSSPVEPALLQDLSNTYIRSINLANIDRTRYAAPDGCEGDDNLGGEEIFVNSTCIQGKVIFTPGTNASISQNTYTNSINFSAVVGSGSGEPCTQIPLYDGEEPPDDSIYLEGGPTCNEVIRSISGASGPRADLSAEGGVDITYEPLENKVVIDVNLKALSTCENTLLVAEASYDDCHHEAGLPGMGPDGGRGVTELALPSFALSALGLFSVPGETVGIGALTLPTMASTGGGGSSGAFSIGFTGYGALSLPSMSLSGEADRPFHISGAPSIVLPRFSMAGSGTGTFGAPPFSATGSGGVAFSGMSGEGEGTFIPWRAPPTGNDMLEAHPDQEFLIVVGYGGTYIAGYDGMPSYVMKFYDYVCYAPGGVMGDYGGYGGGVISDPEINPGVTWLPEYTYEGIVVKRNGGNGGQAAEVDAQERGGGGGGSAGRTEAGHNGGVPYAWKGGSAVYDGGGYSYSTSGRGGDSTVYGVDTGIVLATAPGGGGGGNYWPLREAADGQVIVRMFFNNGSTQDLVYTEIGTHVLRLAEYPGLQQGMFECWGGGGYGGVGAFGYHGGGGGAYSSSTFWVGGA